MIDDTAGRKADADRKAELEHELGEIIRRQVAAIGGEAIPIVSYLPIEVAVALSLYAYNVSPTERAQAIYDYFHGECMDFEDLVHLFITRPAYVATELPLPSAEAYVAFALQKYGDEARHRVESNSL